MAAEFKLICDLRPSESVLVVPGDAPNTVVFLYRDTSEGVGREGSVHVSKAEARAFAHFILSLTE